MIGLFLEATQSILIDTTTHMESSETENKDAATPAASTVDSVLQRLKLGATSAAATPSSVAQLPSLQPAAQPSAGFQVICCGQIESVHVRSTALR